MSDVLPIALEALRTRTTRVFPQQIRAAIDPLTDEQIWWRPNEASNSIGNLLLHLTGSINHYLNRNFGGIDYTRDRAAEFAERQQIPKTELLARFDAMVASAERTYDRLTVDGLGDVSPERTMHRIVIEDLINVMSHFSNHAGQIVWIAKMLNEHAVDEVWMKSHRKSG